MSATIVDVAEAANVSKGTVSRVLNCADGVGAETSKRVLAAMRRLGYSPRPNKRRQRHVDFSGTTLTAAALVFPNTDAGAMHTWFSAGLARGIEQVFYEHDLALVLTHLRPGNKLPACIERRQVQGIITRGGWQDAVAREMLCRFPTVAAMWPVQSIDTDVVTSDAEAGGEMAARFLLERDCRHVVCFSHRAPSASRRPELIQAGVFRCMVEAADARVTLIEYETVAEAVAEYVALDVPPAGAFLTGQEDGLIDTIAVHHAERGYRYPCFVSSKIRPSGCRVPVAMIDPRPEVVGRTAAERLIWRSRNPGAATERLLIDPVLHLPNTRPEPVR